MRAATTATQECLSDDRRRTTDPDTIIKNRYIRQSRKDAARCQMQARGLHTYTRRLAHTRSAEQAPRTPRCGNFPTRPHGDIRAARAGAPPQASQSPSLARNRRARGERGRSSRRERRLAVQSAAGAHVTTRVLSTAWTFRQPGAPLRVLLSGNWHRLPTAISHPLDLPTPQS